MRENQLQPRLYARKLLLAYLCRQIYFSQKTTSFFCEAAEDKELPHFGCKVEATHNKHQDLLGENYIQS